MNTKTLLSIAIILQMLCIVALIPVIILLPSAREEAGSAIGVLFFTLIWSFTGHSEL